MIFYYNSTQTGAPVLSGTPGALKTLLQTCLVTGFGAGSATGITVADGVATVSFSGTHPYIVDGPIAVAGATPAALNGSHTVTAITANSAKFAAPGVPDGAATGTITTRVPGAGWQELFAGTANRLALKPSAPEATGMLLSINDTNATNARVRSYESMSDAITGAGPSPTEQQVPGGLYWGKSSQVSAAERPWYMVADERAFYLAVAPDGVAERHTLNFAGDIASLKSGDAWYFLVTGNESDQTGITSIPEACCGASFRNVRAGAYVQRASYGYGAAVAARRVGAHHNGPTADLYAGTAGYSWGVFPNISNNGLLYGSCELVVGTDIRGTLPGLLHPVQDLGNIFSSGVVIDGEQDMAGRRLLALRVSSPSPSAQVVGTVFMDLTGPWRS